MCGYFSGLSSPSVTEMTTTLARLAQVEQRRADQVADVLDEHHADPAAGASAVQRPAHHVGVEVAAGAGVDLHHAARPSRRIRSASSVGLLVALDDGDRPLVASSRIVRSSSVVLPAPGELIRLRARMCRVREPAAVRGREGVVALQDVALDLDRACRHRRPRRPAQDAHAHGPSPSPCWCTTTDPGARRITATARRAHRSRHLHLDRTDGELPAASAPRRPRYRTGTAG